MRPDQSVGSSRRPADAAPIIATLIRAALSRRLTGVRLTDETALPITRPIDGGSRAAVADALSVSRPERLPRLRPSGVGSTLAAPEQGACQQFRGATTCHLQS